MSKPARPLGRSLGGLLALLFCVALVPRTHADFAVQQRTDADQLVLRNLIGEVKVASCLLLGFSASCHVVFLGRMWLGTGYKRCQRRKPAPDCRLALLGDNLS